MLKDYHANPDNLGRIEADLRTVTAYSQSEHFVQGLELFVSNQRLAFRPRLANISSLAKALRQDVRNVEHSQL